MTSTSTEPATVPPSFLSARGRRSVDSPIGVLMQRALARPELISLAAGFVDPATLPAEAVDAACRSVLASPASAKLALQYGTTAGDALLRRQVLTRLERLDGPTAARHLDQVVLTAGSNQFLATVTALACDPGDVVLCTAPTYFVYLGLLENLGVRAIGVEMDGDGMKPEALEAALAECTARGERERVKLVYVVPDFDNPRGATLSLDRRKRILEIVERERDLHPEHPLYILEDAAYRELCFDGASLPSLLSLDASQDTVLHAFTFSKSLSPGVRVGGGIVPHGWVGRLLGMKGNDDFGSPHFSQRVVSEVLHSGAYEPHLETLRTAYKAKRDATLAALEVEFADLPGVQWQIPQGGLYVWLELPPEIDTGAEGALFGLAMDAGMIYVPGVYAFPAEGAAVRRSCIRLSYGVQPPERITLGVAALAKAVRRILNGGTTA